MAPVTSCDEHREEEAEAQEGEKASETFESQKERRCSSADRFDQVLFLLRSEQDGGVSHPNTHHKLPTGRTGRARPYSFARAYSVAQDCTAGMMHRMLCSICAMWPFNSGNRRVIAFSCPTATNATQQASEKA